MAFETTDTSRYMQLGEEGGEGGLGEGENQRNFIIQVLK